ASDRHLQYLGGPSLIAARSLKRANYVVFLELCKITFKIDPVSRQIAISHRSRLVLQYSFGKPFRSDSAVDEPHGRSAVFPSPVESRDSTVLQGDRSLDCVLEFAYVSRPIVRLQIRHCLF